MILVDSSVWIDHLKNSNKKLIELIKTKNAMSHNFVIGELATGSIKNRKEFLADLCTLPRLENCMDHEVWHFIEANKLYSTGLGYIDVHLLSACKLHNIKLFTLDKKLHNQAKKLKLAG